MIWFTSNEYVMMCAVSLSGLLVISARLHNRILAARKLKVDDAAVAVGDR
jgi:hypothetical protein